MSDSTDRGLFRLDRSEAYLQAEPEAKVEPLTGEIHRITIHDRSTIVLEGPKSLVAVDTFGTPGRARVYRRTLHEEFDDKPIESIVYTHDHLDSSGFSRILAEEAEIIADERTARIVEERDFSSQIVPDVRLSADREYLERVGLSFQLIQPGPTHGTGNRALFVPEEKLLFMSDTILPNARYGLFPDYHLGNFIPSMRPLGNLDFNRFVPGRYGLMNREQFQEGCDYVEAIMNSAQHAFAEGLPIWERETIEQYTIETLEEEFGHLDGFKNHVGLSALRAAHHYLMGGWGLEDTPVEELNLD